MLILYDHLSFYVKIWLPVENITQYLEVLLNMILPLTFNLALYLRLDRSFNSDSCFSTLIKSYLQFCSSEIEDVP